MGFVYFGAYSTALIFFAVFVASRLAGAPHARQLALACVLAYVGGMFFLAHGLYFPIVHGQLENGGAVQLWKSVDESGLSIMGMFDSAGGLWGGGLFVLAVLGATMVLVRWPVDDKLRALDVTAVGLAFALAICKLGCFAVGCCYGEPSDGVFAIHNTWGQNGTDVARLPTQLFDLIGYLAVGVVLQVLSVRQRGKLMLWFVLGYALVRIVTEMTRGDAASPAFGGLSLVQLVLIAGAVVAIAGLAMPRAWLRVWSWRSSEPRAVDVGPGRSWFLVAVVAGTIVFLPLPLFLPLFGVAALVRWRTGRGTLAEPVCGTVLGLFAVTTYYVPSLLPFAISVALLLVAVPLAFERDRARV
jgi:prolipoprotein diacylglyceryltransferase